MKRRGVFGLLAGAAVAGPSMAKAAVADLGSLKVASAAGYGIEAATTGFGGGYPIGPSDEYNPLKWAQAAVQEFMGRSAAELLEARLETTVHALDPDIAGMVSISLDAKIRMMRDRLFERNQRQHLKYLHRELAQAAKRMLS